MDFPTSTCIILDGRCLDISPEYELIAGYSPSELQGTEAIRLVHPDSADLAAERMAEVPRRTFPSRYKILTRTKQTVDVLSSSQRVMIDGQPAVHGQIQQVTGPYSDLDGIADRLHQARDLERAGQYTAAARILSAASLLVAPNTPRPLGISVLMRLGELLVRAGHAEIGGQILLDAIEIATECGITPLPCVGRPCSCPESAGCPLASRPDGADPRALPARARLLHHPSLLRDY